MKYRKKFIFKLTTFSVGARRAVPLTGRKYEPSSWWLLILSLALSLLFLGGCAEITRPTPTGPEQEAAQLQAVRRHPHNTWAMERVSRVFIRLLATLPQIHGHT